MIARQLALACVAVDNRELTALRDRSCSKNQVDAQPATLMEVAGAIIPPAVQLRIVVLLTKQICHTPVAECSEFGALSRADMGGTDELLRVVDVQIGWRDVEVARHDHLLGRLAEGCDVAAQLSEPAQLVLIVIVVKRSTVGDIDTTHSYAIAVGRDDARVWVGVALASEVGDDIAEADRLAVLDGG